MLTLTFTGATLPTNRPLELADLQALGTPTARLDGLVGASDITPGAVNASHVTPGAIVVGSATGTTTLTATLSQVPTAHAAGVWFWLIPASTNTGNVTLTITGLGGTKAVKRLDGSELKPGDLSAGVPALLTYNATGGWYALVNPASAAMTTYAVDSGSANAAVITLPWTIATLADLTGVLLVVKKCGDINTSSLTLNVNSKGAVAVKDAAGDDVRIPGGGLFTVVYTGTLFQLVDGHVPAPVTPAPDEDGGTVSPSGSTVTIPTDAGKYYVIDMGSTSGTVTLSLSGTPAKWKQLILLVKGNTSTATLSLSGARWKHFETLDDTGIINKPVACAAGRWDKITLMYDGSTWFGEWHKNYSTT